MTHHPVHIHATVKGLGRSGDGFIHHNGHIFHIPNTLPGERLHLRLNGEHAELLERENDSPQRVSASCALFGQCGGCAMQGMALPALLEWKTSQVYQALRHAGYNTLPSPSSFQTPPKTRRRMDFALQRVNGGIVLGLHERNGDPVDLTECGVLHPTLMALLPPLRVMLSNLGALTGRGALVANLLESGPDLTLETSAPLTRTDRSKLAAFAKKHAIPRITWRRNAGTETETVVQWEPVFHHFGEVRISPPPATFLQATKEAEHAIIQAVLAGIPSLNRKDRIFELYAGCGTLTFPIAQKKGQVHAYEGNENALQALKTATHGTRVKGFLRDLNRQPLLPHDLKDARVVVLDPPYNGAGKQIMPLASSEVRDIVYVSCNSTALEKDLSPLHQAGFKVLNLAVVDQFLWSIGVESIVTLSRDPKRINKAEKSAL